MDLPIIQVYSPPLELLECLDLPEIPAEDQPTLPSLRTNSDNPPRTTPKPLSKRVGFSDATQYSDSPTIQSHCDETSDHPVISNPEPRPLKGILKSKVVIKEEFSPYQAESLPSMLQTYLNALAVKDLDLRRDAYTNFTNTIKSCHNSMDAKSLKFNLIEICQYIERDLKLIEDHGKPNSSLIVHALSFLRSLQSKSNIVGYFPIDFQVFLVEFCIENFPKPLMSKDVKKNLIFILENHKFSPKVMHPNRAGRLIEALNAIENYATGKSIILGRTEIYRGFLQTSRQQMITHNEWIGALLSGMISNVKGIQTSAIRFGFEASVELGTELQISIAAYKFLKSEAEEGKKPYWATFIHNLVDEADNDSRALIPRVWSVIILLQRCKPLILVKSIFFKPFLEVLTNCFNSADTEIQNEAYFAWNRFIFSINLSHETPEYIRNMLIRPYIQSFRQKKSVNFLSKVYNLFYYAFKPMCPSNQLDLYWDSYLKVFVSHAYLSSEKYGTEMARQYADIASKILIHLFDRKTSRIWTPNKVVQSLGNNDIVVDELPALESKWLRRNFPRVLPVLFSMLERLFWDFSDSSTLAVEVWHNYICSIASPAMMEIKVSPETIGCISRILEFLSQLWNAGVTCSNALPPLSGSQGVYEYLSSVQMIISTMVSDLGISAFTRSSLSNKMSQDTSTPISRLSQQSFDPMFKCRSPFHRLVFLFTEPCPGMIYDSKFQDTIHHILNYFFADMPSRGSKLVTAKELAVELPIKADCIFSAKLIWQSLAIFAINSLNFERDPLTAEEYFNTIDMLKCGIKISPHLILAGWERLLESLLDSVILEARATMTTPSVVETMSKILCETSCGPSYLSSLISRVEYPNNQPTVKVASESADLKVSELTSSDPYSYFYKYLQNCLRSSYNENYENGGIIAKTNSLLNGCSNQVILGVLFQIQGALSPWIIHCNFNHSEEQSILLLWSTFNSALAWILENGDSKQALRDFEILVCSGLESQHSTILDATIGTWNSIFGVNYHDAEYPERLKSALYRLRTVSSEIKHHSLQGTSSSEIVSDERTPLDSPDSSKICGQHSELSLKGKALDSPANTPLKSTPRVVIERDDSINNCEDSTARNNMPKKRPPVSPRYHERPKMRLRSTKSPPVSELIAYSQSAPEKHKITRQKGPKKAHMTPITKLNGKPRRMITNSEPPPSQSPRKSHRLPTRRSTRLATDPTLSSPILTPLPRGNNKANQSISPKNKIKSSVTPSSTLKVSCNNNPAAMAGKCGVTSRDPAPNVCLHYGDKHEDNSSEMHISPLCSTHTEPVEKTTHFRSTTRKRKFVADNEVADSQESSMNQSPKNRAKSKRRKVFEDCDSDIFKDYRSNRSGSIDLDAYREVTDNNLIDSCEIQATGDKNQNQQNQPDLENTSKTTLCNVKNSVDVVEMGNSTNSMISSIITLTAEENEQHYQSKFIDGSSNAANVETSDEFVKIDRPSHAFLSSSSTKDSCLENRPMLGRSLSPAKESNNLELKSLKISRTELTPLDRPLLKVSGTNVSTIETENSKIFVANSTQYILNTIDSLISVLQNATLRKEDVSSIEDRLMDSKRALYEAERRGRQT
ncbi:hypothetical protein K3495_g3074 [Podosphaera aphanis]|nr:hypothetical protein K3495_g3074 [Podosphaera aphanis]